MPKVSLRGYGVFILRLDLRRESVTVVVWVSQSFRVQAVLQKSDDERRESRDGANYSEDGSYGVGLRIRNLASSWRGRSADVNCR